LATRRGENPDKNEKSPIFLQSMDCVYQLIQLNHNSFEFNSDFLLFIGFHCYPIFYGDFFGDTEKERSSKPKPKAFGQ
jgi:myotubularin-related protein 1/2